MDYIQFDMPGFNYRRCGGATLKKPRIPYPFIMRIAFSCTGEGNGEVVSGVAAGFIAGFANPFDTGPLSWGFWGKGVWTLNGKGCGFQRICRYFFRCVFQFFCCCFCDYFGVAFAPCIAMVSL